MISRTSKPVGRRQRERGKIFSADILTDHNVFARIRQIFLPGRFPTVLMVRLLFLLLTIALIVGHGSPGRAQESSFAVPPGLEDAVGFWKRIFTQYGSNEVILFDPLDPVTIYSVL